VTHKKNIPVGKINIFEPLPNLIHHKFQVNVILVEYVKQPFNGTKANA